MSDSTRHEERGPGRGAVVILLAGTILGLASNYVALDLDLPSAISWTPERVPDLSEFQASASSVPRDGAPAGNPVDTPPMPPEARESSAPASTEGEVGTPGTTPVAISAPAPADAGGAYGAGYGEMDDPLGIGATMATPGSRDLPFVPDLGRPIQIQVDAVKRFVDAGAALVIDSREPEEYEAGHIPGSLNLPYEETVTDPERLEAVNPGGRPIIVYCGGGTCETSMNMAWSLIQAGHGKVLVFMGGWPHWEASGSPVDYGPDR